MLRPGRASLLRRLAPLGAALLLVPLLPAGAPAGTAATAGMPGRAAAHDSTHRAASSTPRAVRDASLTPLRRGSLAGRRGEAPFVARLAGETLVRVLTAFPVLPGESVVLEAGATATLVHQAGTARPGDGGAAGEGRWLWTAPGEPGAYALRLVQEGRALELTALVLHPADRARGGTLLGYRIGEYRSRPLRGDPAYLPPRGFVSVARTDRDLLVSPRLTLGQFLCKQPGEPRMVAISRPLLAKLEAVLDRLEDAGHASSSLVVMSGFRTPAYNRAIGNTTDYSRHLWGDAADIYLDADGDGEMDDLDGDGRVDLGDARVLAGLVEEVAERPGVRPGGLAVYRRNAAHGPFVHVDARGTRARW